ncbi:hypothetical protein KX928_13000 [Roseobacter sp. YSTF-M11]|uniref:Uncharacterized protein n=1 Tax=Roseobacter insulae TaxID=2859783 RepID=A0A9X1FX81_9RHOB|nr:hypothetical protein [Roseobacter insulae]MBW4708700.1 hypothetical protein [Roseobacter insulae]
MTDLDARLLAAHEAGDRRALIDLYCEAAHHAQNDAASGFYLTHAYVFALEEGAPEATDLRRKLIAMGRETPL